jgi:hypothetical protein
MSRNLPHLGSDGRQQVSPGIIAPRRDEHNKPVSTTPIEFLDQLADWCWQQALDAVDDASVAYLAVQRRIKEWEAGR